MNNSNKLNSIKRIKSTSSNSLKSNSISKATNLPKFKSQTQYQNVRDANTNCFASLPSFKLKSNVENQSKRSNQAVIPRGKQTASLFVQPLVQLPKSEPNQREVQSNSSSSNQSTSYAHQTNGTQPAVLSDTIFFSATNVTSDVSFNETNSSELLCRICLESCAFELTTCTDSDRRLVAPCRCRGESKYVHLGCLREWLQVSRTDRCQVCQTRIRNVTVCIPTCFQWLLSESTNLIMLLLLISPLTFDVIMGLHNVRFELNTIRLNKTSRDLPERSIATINIIKPFFGSNQTKTAVFPSSHLSQHFQATFTPENVQMSFLIAMYSFFLIRIQLRLGNLLVVLSGIPSTLLLSAPAFYYFVVFCRIRIRFFQRQNRRLILPSARDWID